MQFFNSADLFVCLSVVLLCVGSDSRSRNKESGGSHEADRRDKRCVSRAASIISVSIYTCANTHAYMHFGNGSRRLSVCHSAVCEQRQPQPQGPRGQQARRARSRRYQQQGLNPLEIIPPSLKTAMVTCTILGASSIRGHSHSPT